MAGLPEDEIVLPVNSSLHMEEETTTAETITRLIEGIISAPINLASKALAKVIGAVLGPFIDAVQRATRGNDLHLRPVRPVWVQAWHRMRGDR